MAEVSGGCEGPDLAELPTDLLLKVFSLLSLKEVLKFEHLSRRLQQVVALFLTTCKNLNFYHGKVAEDIFRVFDPSVTSLPLAVLATLIYRCPNATTAEYLSVPPPSKLDKLLVILNENKHLKEIKLCDDITLLLRITKEAPHISITSICLKPIGSLLATPVLSRLVNVRRLHLHSGELSDGLPNFPLLESLTLQDIKLGSMASPPELPRLREFNFSGSMGSDMYRHTPAFGTLLRGVVASEILSTLKLSLTKFDALESVVDDWKATSLTSFELHSSALYIAAFEQFKYTSVVAQICTKIASTLQRINIPSSIMVKHFCVHFISNGVQLPALQKISVNGLADTKMFLSPGNMVESRFYREFLTLCPKIESLSLHSFSGSLASLPLPLSLTQLTLPWDNRLNLSNQKDAILATISTLPNLQNLSIAGVEEVEGVLLDTSAEALHSRTAPFLEIESSTLTEFRISNAYVGGLDLRGCTSLRGFALHCCPVLKELKLPTKSLEEVRIYDNYRPFIDNFLTEFTASEDHPSSCYINLQIHSVRPAPVELTNTPTETSSELYATTVRAFAAKKLDYCILKRLGLRELEHNSGEPMFPCTEFQTNDCLFNRSYTEIVQEKQHHDFVMEGIQRWRKCLSQVKTLVSSTNCTSVRNNLPAINSTMLFCGAEFQCCTNIPHFFALNKSSSFVQPSSPSDSARKDTEVLNVPRLEASMEDYLAASPQTKAASMEDYLAASPQTEAASMEDYLASSPQSPATNCPLVVLSILEYMHNVHTLFYY